MKKLKGPGKKLKHLEKKLKLSSFKTQRIVVTNYTRYHKRAKKACCIPTMPIINLKSIFFTSFQTINAFYVDLKKEKI